MSQTPNTSEPKPEFYAPLNIQELNPGFYAALEKSADERAMWPPAKHTYVRGESPDCALQCLVWNLTTQTKHGGPEKGWHLVPGIAYGPGLEEKGMWHFRLEKEKADGARIPVDKTWHQFQKGVVFVPARPEENLTTFAIIMSGSLMQDASLVTRVGIIRENLAKNGEVIESSARDIVSAAQEKFLEQVLKAQPSRSHYAYMPAAEDWKRIGNRLSDYTDSRGGSTYNPISFAFRFAANEHGKPIAEAVATINQGEAELNLLYVEKGARNEGIGRYFVMEFEKIAKAMGAVSAIVRTPTWQAAGEKPGEGYYQQHGYKEVVRYPVHPDADNKPQSNIILYKDLRTA